MVIFITIYYNMSYSHNPFLVLSDNLLSTGIDDVTYRLKAAENKLKDTVLNTIYRITRV